MYSIWTRSKSNQRYAIPLVHMMGGFNSIHEAMAWLTNTYAHDAEFWVHLKEVRVSLD